MKIVNTYLIFFVLIFSANSQNKNRIELENDKKLITNFIQNIIIKEDNNNYEEINRLTMLCNQNPDDNNKKN